MEARAEAAHCRYLALRVAPKKSPSYGALILRSRTLAVGIRGKHSIRSRFEVRGRLVRVYYTEQYGFPYRRLLFREARLGGTYPKVTRTGFQPLKSTNRGVPTGIRTPVLTVKGWCPRPLDDGDSEIDKQTKQSQSNLVEPGGIEPPTSCMPCKRSPS